MSTADVKARIPVQYVFTVTVVGKEYDHKLFMRQLAMLGDKYRIANAIRNAVECSGADLAVSPVIRIKTHMPYGVGEEQDEG